jgi:integrase
LVQHGAVPAEIAEALAKPAGARFYSLRHSFKDRLIATGAPHSLIDSLMGHKTYKPKYGKGPSSELKLKYLQRIAFKPPASL